MTQNEPQSRVPTVSAGYLFSLFENIVALGITAKEITDKFPELGQEPEFPSQRYPANLLLLLLHYAEDVLETESIGLKVGAGLKPTQSVDVLYATTVCKTLGDSIALNLKYQPLIQEIGRTRLHIEGSTARLVWHIGQQNADWVKPVTDAVMTGYSSIGRWLVWADAPPIIQAHFRYSAPKDLGDHERIFGPSMSFDAQRDELVFPASLLDTPLPGHNPELLRRLTARLDVLLGQLHEPGGLVREIKSILTSQIGINPIHIGTIANHLNMNERTLRRRLDAENTSFREISISTRKTLAETFLMDPAMSLSEVAQNVGFSDQTAFSRAFKDWFGQSPKAYRENLNSPSA